MECIDRHVCRVRVPGSKPSHLENIHAFDQNVTTQPKKKTTRDANSVPFQRSTHWCSACISVHLSIFFWKLSLPNVQFRFIFRIFLITPWKQSNNFNSKLLRKETAKVTTEYSHWYNKILCHNLIVDHKIFANLSFFPALQAYSHSASVGNRLPAHSQYATASCQDT